MTRRQAELELRRTLVLLHQRARRLSRQEIVVYERALRALTRGLSGGRAALLSARQATALIREVNNLLALIDRTLQESAGRAITNVSRAVQDEYGKVHVRLFTASQMSTQGVSARFEVIPRRVDERLVGLYGRNLTLPVLTGRHIDAARDSVEAYVRAATGRVPDATAVRSIRRMLEGQLPIDMAGLDPKQLTPARGLIHRGVRIIGTESFHALREGTAEGSSLSPIIYIARWLLSDRHHDLPSSPDACDDLAKGGRLIDDTPGWYTPEAFPIAPHPHCECFQGDVRVISPEEWDAAMRR